MELACAIIQNTQDPAEILRLYNASATLRQYVEACAEVISSPRLRALPLRSTFPLLALPRLRQAHNIAFAVDDHTDVAAIMAAGAALDNVVFIVSAKYLLMPLIQRLMDVLGNAFLAKRWLFAVPGDKPEGYERSLEEATYHYLIIADYALLSNEGWDYGDPDPAIEAIWTYLGNIGFGSAIVGGRSEYAGYLHNAESIGVISSLLLDMLESAPFPNTDPYRPQTSDNPPLSQSLLLWQWGLVNEAYIRVVLLAIVSELVVRGKDSLNLARWANKIRSILGARAGIQELEHGYLLHVHSDDTPWYLIETARPPTQITAEVRARAAEENTFLRNLSRSYVLRRSDPLYVGTTPYSFAMPPDELKEALSIFPRRFAMRAWTEFWRRGRNIGEEGSQYTPEETLPAESPILMYRGDIYRSPQ